MNPSATNRTARIKVLMELVEVLRTVIYTLTGAFVGSAIHFTMRLGELATRNRT